MHGIETQTTSYGTVMGSQASCTPAGFVKSISRDILTIRHPIEKRVLRSMLELIDVQISMSPRLYPSLSLTGRSSIALDDEEVRCLAFVEGIP